MSSGLPPGTVSASQKGGINSQGDVLWAKLSNLNQTHGSTISEGVLEQEEQESNGDPDPEGQVSLLSTVTPAAPSLSSERSKDFAVSTTANTPEKVHFTTENTHKETQGSSNPEDSSPPLSPLSTSSDHLTTQQSPADAEPPPINSPLVHNHTSTYIFNMFINI